MPGSRLPYAARKPHGAYEALVRGAECVTQCEMRRDGALVAPSSGTYTLLGPTGSAVVDAAAVTVSGSVAEYTIPAATLASTLEYSSRYQERWSLVMPDGTTRVVRFEAALVPFELFCPVAQDDLVAGRYPLLVSLVGASLTDLQDYIDNAWDEFLEWLWGQERWPEMLTSVSAFRAPVREGALYLIFRSLFRQQSGTNRWHVLMDKHEAAMHAARAAFTSRVDEDLDGQADAEDRQGVSNIVHRGPARGAMRRRWVY